MTIETPNLRLGVDVGGTNTDAALLSPENKVVGSAKVGTTADVLTGIEHAVRAALQQAQASPEQVVLSSFGTTHFVNALTQRKGLARVAVLRLCGPATRALPPFVDIPDELREILQGPFHLLAGGFEFDGGEVISDIDEPSVRRALREVVAGGIPSVVVSGVFSPVNSSQEDRVHEILQDELRRMSRETGVEQQMHITLSHQIGQLGLLERENAAILNAALRPLAAHAVPAMQQALASIGIQGELFLTSNDGTLMSATAAKQMPIATLQSGPVNSLRGAAFLSGATDAVVLDIGGTTTDVGVLVHSLPRPAALDVSLCGVRTNFQMPDVISIGLGGGSLVQWTDDDKQQCTVGPQSVGYQLPTRALAAGGDVCTATDVAVVLHRMRFGSIDKAVAGLEPSAAQQAWDYIQDRLEKCVDLLKTSPGDVPVIVVGGGAALCGDSLPGAAQVSRPPHAEVANAIGAAIPQVSGVVDGVFRMGADAQHRTAVLQDAERAASAKATAAGADLATCQVVSREEVPLAYLPGGVTRVRVRVVGDLAAASATPALPPVGFATGQEDSPVEALREETCTADAGDQAGTSNLFMTPWSHEPPAKAQDMSDQQEGAGERLSWQPQVDAEGAWLLSRQDLDALAIGTGVLGTGGGGSPAKARLKVLQEMSRGKVVRVIAPAAVPPDSLVVELSGMGAPTVGIEKLDSHQTEAAARACAETGAGTLFALISGEIGGGNGLEPLSVGPRMGLPVVDGDFMGRAFPELQMDTRAIAGIRQTPAALADEKGNVVMVERAVSPVWLEQLLRPVCTAMGCSAGYAAAPISGAQLRRVVVPHTLSLAWHLGRAVLSARASKADSVAAVAAEGGGRLLFQGKVVDVRRTTAAGFACGEVQMEGLGPFQGRVLRINIQNENLVARLDGQVVASVPDLICCLETHDGRPVQTEELRYGLRLSVVGLPAHPLLRTPEALAVVGPAAFGYADVPYMPLGHYKGVQPIPAAASQVVAPAGMTERPRWHVCQLHSKLLTAMS
ncbi:hypothetical protein WJX72_010677 [[Myrmecia] bisecta]|uniref:Hydantoinase n=1 Tax=[Myrmecia] bisecta TaxID=41462 RepID=A0AAW1QGD5_9CHLO